MGNKYIIPRTNSSPETHKPTNRKIREEIGGRVSRNSDVMGQFSSKASMGERYLTLSREALLDDEKEIRMRKAELDKDFPEHAHRPYSAPANYRNP